PGTATGRLGALESALERYHTGDLAGATEALAVAVAENPEYADLRCRYAGLLLETGRADEALDQLTAALRINPRYLEARLLAARAQRLLGLIYHALGRQDEALRAVRRGLTRDRELPREALDAAAMLLSIGDRAGAESEIQRALSLQPDYPDLHLAQARIRSARG